MPFLTDVISTIDKSYSVTDMSETLTLFFRLAIAQSVHVLRSCTINKIYGPINQSYLIISILCLHPLIENNNLSVMYQFIPLPAIVNLQQYIYSSTPRLITINKDDQGIILWSNVLKETEYLFSIFVYCRKKLPMI